eukprot:3455244-Amphidinium_carterae.1
MDDEAFKQCGAQGFHYCEIREMTNRKLAKELARGQIRKKVSCSDTMSVHQQSFCALWLQDGMRIAAAASCLQAPCCCGTHALCTLAGWAARVWLSQFAWSQRQRGHTHTHTNTHTHTHEARQLGWPHPCNFDEARRTQLARTGKLRLAALGLPGTHWASEAMQHDMARREAGYLSGRDTVPQVAPWPPKHLRSDQQGATM